VTFWAEVWRGGVNVVCVAASCDADIELGCAGPRNPLLRAGDHLSVGDTALPRGDRHEDDRAAQAGRAACVRVRVANEQDEAYARPIGRNGNTSGPKPKQVSPTASIDSSLLRQQM
jgi:hypothetical protein